MRSVVLALGLAACASDPAVDGPTGGGGKADDFESDAAAARAAAVGDLLEGVRDDADALRAWLQPMPKGGDLHSHLSGAVATERLIEWGATDGFCVTPALDAASPCPMDGTSLSMLDDELRSDVIGAWSLEGRQDAPVAERHKHFFDAFLKFGPVTWRRTVDMIVEAKRTAARDGVQYLELMISLGSSTGGRVGQRHLTAGGAWDDERLETGRAAILADAEIATMLTRTKRDLDSWDRAVKTSLGCAGDSSEPACEVDVRYLVQAVRTQPREHVFGQFVYGFALAAADPRVVGVNLVQAEEDPTSLSAYGDHMRAIGYLTAASPEVKVALHAGELTPDFAAPEHLASHVREAVEVAGASRIGHAVDILGEDDAPALVADMAERGVLVEACLTSNQQLLDIEGEAHPIGELVRRGVPVALATDDQGLLRSAMTDELVRAVAMQELTYFQLKAVVRASLAHSFLPGARLRDLAACRAALVAEALDDACEAALEQSEKAAAEWRLETALDDFERALTE